MFTDPITPKSYPEKLSAVDYDPFGLMPRKFPAHPHLFVTKSQIAFTKRLVAQGGWPRKALDMLFENAAKPHNLPTQPPAEADAALAWAAVRHALRNAWAALYTGDKKFRERALDSMRRLSRAYPSWPIKRRSGRLGTGDINEAHFIMEVARAYDCLAAGPLSASDNRLFRGLLESTHAASDAPAHNACGNHGTAVLMGRLAAAIALHDPVGMHDALYGHIREGCWRYGIIHQLRHDILDDGMHWERVIGYHGFTLSLIAHIADLMLPLGIDLWHAKLPPLWQNDGSDLHRDYGTKLGHKTIKAAFDAPFYCSLPNGDLSTLGDSRLENLRGMFVWGILIHRAYDIYRDPKYIWLINKAEAEYPDEQRERPGLPLCLQSEWVLEAEFARLGPSARARAGMFDLSKNTALSLRGEQRGGCTQFDATGATVLRADTKSAKKPAVFFFWGPHSAGHQAPAALHIDISGAGAKATDAPRMKKGDYTDPLYLTWARTTIAHNTLTVDATPMFPYDFPSKSLWEADGWRDSISDGECLLFQPDGAGFKAARAINERVYPGARLDRTIIVTTDLVLDAFRVIAERTRMFDWAMHVVGTPILPSGARTASLGRNRGYCHFRNIKRLPGRRQPFTLTWEHATARTHATCILPARAKAFVARDPIPTPEDMHTIGEIGSVPPRHTLIIRTTAKQALFLSAWSFMEGPMPLRLIKGGVADDLVITTGRGSNARKWLLPMGNAPVAARV